MYLQITSAFWSDWKSHGFTRTTSPSRIRGEYGTTPAPIDEAIRSQILGEEKPLEGRYADTLAPVVESARAELGELAKSDEDVLSYIAFPNLAEKYLTARKEKEENAVTYSIVEA